MDKTSCGLCLPVLFQVSLLLKVFLMCQRAAVGKSTFFPVTAVWAEKNLV